MKTHTQEFLFTNPAGFEIQVSELKEFERGLDPRDPEKSQIPCHVLGYGEISTVLDIERDGFQGLAFKRMCAFKNMEEMRAYIATYREYNHRLESVIRLHLPAHGYVSFVCDSNDPIFYIVQKKLASWSICSKALHHLLPSEVVTMFGAVLGELDKVWQYNSTHPDAMVGIDGQLSNWAIEGFDPYRPELKDDINLVYIDTSTPLCTQDGVEQLDPELFLRSAPPYLVWILRLLFLKDVMTRYYDPRKVMIDVIANFYKEQKPELIPEMVACANDYIIKTGSELALQPITEKEVQDYYREDKLIWSMYLSMRRFDRLIRNRLFRQAYPYILPGKIKR